MSSALVRVRPNGQVLRAAEVLLLHPSLISHLPILQGQVILRRRRTVPHHLAQTHGVAAICATGGEYGTLDPSKLLCQACQFIPEHRYVCVKPLSWWLRAEQAADRFDPFSLGEGSLGKPEAKRLETRFRDGHKHSFGCGRKSRPGFVQATGPLKRGVNVGEHSAKQLWIEVPKLIEGSPKLLHKPFDPTRAWLVVALERIKAQGLWKLAKQERCRFLGVCKRVPDGCRIRGKGGASVGVLGKVAGKGEERLHNIQDVYALAFLSGIDARKSFSNTTARTPPILQY